MEAKYQIGQKVTITPVKARALSPRDATLEPYAGEVGKVTDYYWVSPSNGKETFFIYTVRMETDQKEVVVHEDEVALCIE